MLHLNKNTDMANLIQRLRNGLTAFNQPHANMIVNKFNESFLWNTAAGYTDYDAQAPTYINKGYNINPIVYSVVNQQSVKTASIPFYVKRVEDKAARRKLRALESSTNFDLTPSQYVKRLMLENKALSAEELDFPLIKPNVNQTWKQFIALYKTFLKTTGNAYLYMESAELGLNAGVPRQIYLLPSQFIQIVVKPNANVLIDENPVLSYMLNDGVAWAEFPAKDVIHIKYSNPNYTSSGEHLYGQSPLRAALKNIQSSNSALDLNIKTLKSGGAFGLIHGKGIALRSEQAQEIKDRLLEMDASPENLSKIAGVSAEVGFTRLSLTSDELQPFSYLSFDQKQVCNVLGWDDKLLNNDDGAKYDNVDFARKRVVTDDIVPDLDMFTEAFNRDFLPRFPSYKGTEIRFDVMELPEMQSDIVELSVWLQAALDRGVITRNEYRMAIRYTPIESDPNMDKFTVQDDILLLDEAVTNTFGNEPTA